METLISAAFKRSRTFVLLLLFILITGWAAYISIPKEAEPDVSIPYIYVSLRHEGISPDDAERLLIKPIEKEVQSIEGVKEVRSVAQENYASVIVEFEAGADNDKALKDVRDKVDIAKAELPADTDEPRVNEINVALFPVLTVILSGQVPEKTLIDLSKDLQDKIEALTGVLEVDIGGNREEMIEIIVDPLILETYNIVVEDLYNFLQRNNQLIAAGSFEGDRGRFIIKVPGIIEDVADVLNLPLKVEGSTVVTFQDIAQVRRTFKDPTSFARLNKSPAISLEVKKRIGANIIETIAEIREIVDQESSNWPVGIQISYVQDKSQDIIQMLGDLENNVVSAIILVILMIIVFLGIRPSLLVGIAIPGSFLFGILIINLLGLTMNIVVLFSLILVVGMLVDGAIVVVELAERNMHEENMSPLNAYKQASIRMSWPVISSNITTIVVFLPLLFWPGIVGQFMKYLPVTVIITLLCSLLMALIFIPIIGSLMSKIFKKSLPEGSDEAHMESNSPRLKDHMPKSPTPLLKWYLERLKASLRHPGKTILSILLIIIGIYTTYIFFNRGVEFFPSIEPDFAQLQVRQRGDFSIYEKDQIVRDVEELVLDMPEIDYIYTRTFTELRGGKDERAEDVIGLIQLDFVDWSLRRPADEILKEIRTKTDAIPGIIVETMKERRGPGQGKPIYFEVTSFKPQDLLPATHKIFDMVNDIEGIKDLESSLPLPGIEWQINVDREKAAQFGVDISLLGAAVQLVTGGIKVTEYRPDDTDEELDIRVRFPFNNRNLDQLTELRIQSKDELIPIANFVSFKPAPKTGTIRRTDAKRIYFIKADVEQDYLVDDVVQNIKGAIAGAKLDPNIIVKFKGEDKDQAEAANFLKNAFVIAIFLMLILLVTQFNSIYQALLVLSAILFSTAGVLIGLMATGQPFGVVMCGIGVIALAGIVVNNNIILIDTYNEMRSYQMKPMDAMIATGAKRMRPVLLTSVTTILGLMPMVLALNIDFFEQVISIGAPATQWWRQLSSSIAGGLAFATILTLILTPCFIILGEEWGEKIKGWFA